MLASPWLTIAAGLSLAGAVLFGYGQYQRAERHAADAQEARQAAASREKVLGYYRRQGRLNSQRLATMEAELNTTHQLLADRRRRLTLLERENAELKEWADRPLPEPVVRLRQRPAITGARDYQRWLSTDNALLPASVSPREER